MFLSQVHPAGCVTCHDGEHSIYPLPDHRHITNHLARSPFAASSFGFNVLVPAGQGTL